MKLSTSMVPHQLAYVIGNDAIGIWSSPSLELVYEAPHAKPPLAAAAAPESLTAQAPRRPGEVVR